jgi:hypothetical protein
MLCRGFPLYSSLAKTQLHFVNLADFLKGFVKHFFLSPFFCLRREKMNPTRGKKCPCERRRRRETFLGPQMDFPSFFLLPSLSLLLEQKEEVGSGGGGGHRRPLAAATEVGYAFSGKTEGKNLAHP